MKNIRWIFALLAGLSLSSFGAPPVPPVISNQPPSNVTDAGAYVNGFLSSTGEASTVVSVYWGLTDGGTTEESWGHTNIWPSDAWAGGSYPSTNIVGLTSETTYYYTYRAASEMGTNWATPSTNFTTTATSQGIQDVGGGDGSSYIYSTNAADVAIIQGMDQAIYRVDETYKWNYYRSNCVIWWSFSNSNSATTVYDTSTNGNNGTVFMETATVNRHTNDCYFFTAANQNAIRSVVSGIGDGSAAMTIALWVYYPAASRIGNVIYYNSRNESVNVTRGTMATACYNYYFGQEYSSSYPCSFVYTNVPGWNYYANLNSSFNLAIGSWHRIVVCYQKNSYTGDSTAYGRLWLDGVSQTYTTTAKDFPLGSAYWWLGAPLDDVRGWQDKYVDDFVVDLKYWDASMIASDYALGRSRTLIYP